MSTGRFGPGAWLLQIDFVAVSCGKYLLVVEVASGGILVVDKSVLLKSSC
jgi:hypothetical protein